MIGLTSFLIRHRMRLEDHHGVAVFLYSKTLGWDWRKVVTKIRKVPTSTNVHVMQGMTRKG